MLKRALFAAVATVVFMLPSAAPAANMALVPAEGTAQRADDIAEVKKRAMDDALRKAVIEAARSILAKEALSLTDQALSQVASAPRAYVVNYRIRSEGWVTHMDPATIDGAAVTELYHIWLEATVDADALRAAVVRLAAAGTSLGRVVINILEVSDYPTFRLVVRAVEKVPSITDVSYGSFARGRMTLVATVSGDAAQLAARIAREVPEQFAVMEGAGQIIIRPSALVTR